MRQALCRSGRCCRVTSTNSSLHTRLVAQHQQRTLAGFPGVDGQYTEGSKASSSNISVDLNKNSKLRTILISVDVLTGANEVLDKKSVVDVAKKTAAAAHASLLASESEGKTVKINTYDTSNEVEGVTDLKAKYMDKMKNKLNGRNLPSADDTSLCKGGGGSARRGDSEFLSVGRAASAHVDAEKAKKQGAWMLVNGMGALLEYCSHRTMQIGM